MLDMDYNQIQGLASGSTENWFAMNLFNLVNGAYFCSGKSVSLMHPIPGDWQED